MEFEIRSHVTAEDLRRERQAALRKGRRRDFLAQTVTTGLESAALDDAGRPYLAPPPHSATGRRSGREVRDAIIDRRMSSAQRLQAQSPEQWKSMIDNLRTLHPSLTQHLTDMEIYTMMVERTAQESVGRVAKSRHAKLA